MCHLRHKISFLDTICHSERSEESQFANIEAGHNDQPFVMYSNFFLHNNNVITTRTYVIAKYFTMKIFQLKEIKYLIDISLYKNRQIVTKRGFICIN